MKFLRSDQKEVSKGKNVRESSLCLKLSYSVKRGKSQKRPRVLLGEHELDLTRKGIKWVVERKLNKEKPKGFGSKEKGKEPRGSG